MSWVLKHDLASDFGAGEIADNIRDCHERIVAVDKQLPNPTTAFAIAEGFPEDEYVFVRGNHKAPGQLAPRQFLTAIVGNDVSLDRETSSGRLRLAQQIVDPSNPLTSRVIVNRVWHHLFGRGIVRSVDNFGVLGEAPSHPELLDHLADEFVKDGWSIKRLIRKLMLTKAYARSSALIDDSEADAGECTVSPGQRSQTAGRSDPRFDVGICRNAGSKNVWPFDPRSHYAFHDRSRPPERFRTSGQQRST